MLQGVKSGKGLREGEILAEMLKYGDLKLIAQLLKLLYRSLEKKNSSIIKKLQPNQRLVFKVSRWVYEPAILYNKENWILTDNKRLQAGEM